MTKEELIIELQNIVKEYKDIKYEYDCARNNKTIENCKRRLDGIELRVWNYYMTFGKVFPVPDTEIFLSPHYFISDLERWIDLLKNES